MRISYPEELPISQARGDIAAAIKAHPVVIVAGETGSGKTTQLPKICLELGRGAHGRLIGCTEPRRVAALSVADRVAKELGGRPGELVGYQIRFQEKTGRHTRVKFMTDGVLLAQTRSDRDLRAYDTLIIDEAHERSLNIDFLLGVLKRLLARRDDLKVIVSSATLDVERFSHFFAGPGGEPAPVICVSGRNYPVDVVYMPPGADRPPAADAPAAGQGGGKTGEGKRGRDKDKDDADDDYEIEVEVGKAVRRLWGEHGPGDTLVFLSGEQDIRETCAHLEGMRLPNAEILPLYGRMTAEQQQRIFYPGNRHRVIVATNVAETSITVPRVRFVVDSGQARIKRYNPRNQIEMLQVERVSRASAAQRAGRCGRVGPGVCARLYSEDDFLKRDEFTPPEIQRSSLAGVILQMDALGLGKIEEFPFLEPPSNALVKSGYDELAELGGIDENRAVTAVGRQLAVLPLGPRCGRMLLAGAQYGVLEDALTVVAALETADPRLRPLEQKEAADARHKQYQDAFSDFRSFLHLWKKVEQERATLSGNKFHQFCRKEFLSWMRLREWREVRSQLAELVAEHKFADLPPAGPAPVVAKNRKTALPEERLHQALLSGLLGKVGAWHEDDKIYRGARGSAFHLWPGSGLSGTHPAWVMAAEVVETSRVFARTAAAVQPEWIERQAAHLLKRSYADPFFDAEFGCVRAYMSATLFGLPLIVRRKALYAPVDPEKAREIFIADGLVGGQARCNLDFYRHNLSLVETVREREEKLRRRGLVVSAEGLAEFYRARLPRDICDVSALERWVLAEKKAGRAPITMSEADVVVESVTGLSADLFPPAWRRQKFNLALTYKFEPGADDDGVTCTVPAGALAGLNPGEFAWLVPGLLGEKVALLLRTLPRGTRREIQPVTEAVDKVLPKLRSVFAGAGKHAGLPPLLDALADALWRATGVKTAPGDYRPGDLPPFLNMNFRVVDEKGTVIRAGRDLERLQRECAADARDNFAAAPKGKFERVGLTKWDFDFPAMAPLPGGAVGFPGLKDCGRDVSLLLYDNPEKAERVTRKGLCRLALLEMGSQADRVSRSLPISRAAALFFGSIKGDAAQLRGAVMDAAARELVRQDRKLPRNRAEFDALLARFKREFYGAAYALGEAASGALETASRLYSPVMRSRPTPAREPSFNDMRAQLAALINPGFVADAGAAYLPRLARYLQALELRLTKLEANLQRDARRTAEIAPLWDLCVRGFARCRAEKRPVPEALARYRWLLEEYRIVLFAQEVGAFEPASKEKLEALAREFA